VKGLGDAYLDGHAEVDIDRVARLRLTLAATTSAVDAVRRRRLAAMVRVRDAEATSLLDAAAAKRRELQDLEAKCLKLLAPLSVLQGVEYNMAVCNGQRTGHWMSPIAPSGPPDFQVPAWLLPSECAPAAISGGYAVPRSRRLRDEIAALERQAKEVQAREVALEGVA